MVYIRLIAIAMMIFFAAISVTSTTARGKQNVNFVGEVDKNFIMCVQGQGYNCVIDGDSFRLEGENIRILTIDAPEEYRAECPAERKLGVRAAMRLLELLNDGPFTLERSDEEPDRDKYHRPLRRVTRDGKNITDILIKEGLARRYLPPWERKESWCETLERR